MCPPPFRVEQQLERFRQQRRYDQAGRMKFHGHDAYIVLLAFHHRIDIGRLPGENRKLQLRIRTQKLLIDRWHQRIVQRIHADDADARAVVLLHPDDLAVQIHPLLRQRDKLLAAGSQLYRALTFVAHDQLNTDLLFQLQIHLLMLDCETYKDSAAFDRLLVLTTAKMLQYNDSRLYFLR